MRVYIIGAGPGDPKLLTLRGHELIAACPVILYTGSLVPRAVLGAARPDAAILDSSGMTLDEIEAVFVAARDADHDVARVHTGDPAIFGSIAEQLRRLDRLGIDYDIVPGVSSFTAAAAALRCELTLPETTQTVILTRAAGRTPVPESESLADLGRHGSTMCLFLSVTHMEQVVSDLAPSYGWDAAVAVVQRASWPDQVIVRGVLGDIAAKVRAARITATALIIVGPALAAAAAPASRLYAADFSHRSRRATAPEERPS